MVKSNKTKQSMRFELKRDEMFLLKRLGSKIGHRKHLEDFVRTSIDKNE